MYFNLFVVPQAFQLSSSGQTKFIPAWTCVEEAPLSTKRITRGGEEMAEVRDLSLMLLGKHVWRHFTGLTVRPCWDQSSSSLSNVRGQADSALLDPSTLSECYPPLGRAGTAAAGSACHTLSWLSVKISLQLMIILGELGCLVKASCVGMPRLPLPRGLWAAAPGAL